MSCEMCRTGIVLALLISSAARADEWSMTDTAVEVAFAGATFVDVTQTRWCLAARKCGEGNPLYGTNPKLSTLTRVGVGVVLAHAVISRLLPQPYRRIWQAETLIIEVGVVGHNISVLGGLKIYI